MIDLQQLRSRTILSAFSIFFQNGFVAILGIGAQIAMTSYLSPNTYGVYTAIMSFMSFFNYFSDIGLSASLVQKKEIDQEDIKTVFTVQQIIVIALCIFGFYLTDKLIIWYGLPDSATKLYWAMLIAFFLSSWRSIPTIILERDMKLYKLVPIQIVENSLFQALVIVGVVSGWGLISFAIATLVRSIIGLIALYKIAPWKITFGINMDRIKQLFSYGLPMQLNSILALVKDDLMNLALGKLVGLEALGYIAWAKKWAEMPIRMILDSVNRILFSLFSRVRETEAHLRSALEKMIYYQSLVIFPMIMAMILLMSTFVQVIPNYNKWLPALPLFYIFCIATALSASPFTNLFNAVGKVKWTLGFMIVWTAATWIIVPILSQYYGMYGFPITQILLMPIFFVTMHYAKKIVKFHFWSIIYKPFFAAIAILIPFEIVQQIIFRSGLFINKPVFIFIILGGAAALSYFLIMKFIFKINLFQELSKLKNKAKN